MNFFEGVNPDHIKINKFIFHVVHHGEDEPILLDETPIDGHETFFINRLKDTLEGNRFEFVDTSVTLEHLKKISKNPDVFVEVSKKLATSFHQAQNETIKPGVIILMQISADEHQLFSIIKYDHEETLSYKLQDNDSKAILEDIKNSFTKSKKSLHKSAMIQLIQDTGELIILDQKVRDDISVFFKGFLGVRRKYSAARMTEVLNKVFLDTVRKHKDILPRSITSNARQVIHDIVAKTDFFEVNDFFLKAFGTYGDDKVKKTFMSKIARNDLDGEQFSFDKNAIPVPKKRKLETIEGVKIQYDQTAADSVEIKHGDGNQPTKITITTDKLIEQ